MKIENVEKMRTDVANTLKNVFSHAEDSAKVITEDGFTINNPVVIKTDFTSGIYLAIEVSGYDGSIFIWNLHKEQGDRLHGIIDPKDFSNKMTMIAYLVRSIMVVAHWDNIDLF